MSFAELQLDPQSVLAVPTQFSLSSIASNQCSYFATAVASKADELLDCWDSIDRDKEFPEKYLSILHDASRSKAARPNTIETIVFSDHIRRSYPRACIDESSHYKIEINPKNDWFLDYIRGIYGDEGAAIHQRRKSLPNSFG